MKKLCVFLLLVAMFLSASASATASDFDREVILIQENTYNISFEILREGIELEWSYVGENDFGEFYGLRIKDVDSNHLVMVLFGEEDESVGYNEFFFYLEDFTDEKFIKNMVDIIMINLMSMEPDKSVDECGVILEKFIECFYECVFNENYNEEYTWLGTYGGSLGMTFDAEHMAICITADY